jgi:hypothetical protein
MMSTVTPTDLEPGAEWTFTHTNGKTTLYIYDKLLAGPGGSYDAMHSLLNPATGKCAQVTESWLRGHRKGGGTWLTGNHVTLPEAA